MERREDVLKEYIPLGSLSTIIVLILSRFQDILDDPRNIPYTFLKSLVSNTGQYAKKRL